MQSCYHAAQVGATQCKKLGRTGWFHFINTLAFERVDSFRIDGRDIGIYQ